MLGKKVRMIKQENMSIKEVERVYKYENEYLKFNKNEIEAVVKNTMKKKIISPINTLLLKVLNTIWLFVNTKKLEGIKSVNVL